MILIISVGCGAMLGFMALLMGTRMFASQPEVAKERFVTPVGLGDKSDLDYTTHG